MSQTQTTRSSSRSIASRASRQLATRVNDNRTAAGCITGLTARLKMDDRTEAEATVRAVASQDLVLVLPEDADVSVGRILSFTICEDGNDLIAGDGVVHWVQRQNGARVAAIFSAIRLNGCLEHRIVDDCRMDIRFPFDLPVRPRSGRSIVDSRLVNYSLNGVCLLTRNPMELNRPYFLTLGEGQTRIYLRLNPQWQTRSANGYHVGCSLPPNHGTLFARLKSSGEITGNCVVGELTPPDKAQESATHGPTTEQRLEFASRFVVPCLSAATLITSWTMPGSSGRIFQMAGLIGVVASLVLSRYRSLPTHSPADSLSTAQMAAAETSGESSDCS